MQDYAVTQGEFVTVFDDEVACTAFPPLKMMHPKRIGRNQAVSPSMPPSGVPQIFWMIKDRHTNLVAVNKFIAECESKIALDAAA